MKKILNLMLVLTLVFMLSGFTLETDEETYEFDDDYEKKDTYSDEHIELTWYDVDEEHTNDHDYEQVATIDSGESYVYKVDEKDTYGVYLIEFNNMGSNMSTNVALEDKDGDFETIWDETGTDEYQYVVLHVEYHDGTYAISNDSSYDENYQMPEMTPKIEESLFENLDGIVGGTIDIFETAFSDDGLAQIFYDFEANDGDGKVTVIGALSLLGVGFVLVRYGFKYVVRLMRFRG